MGSATKSLYEAKTHLSELVERAARGEEIVIAKNGVPMARLAPLAKKTERRAPGGWEGEVWVAEDFDAPLPAEGLTLVTADRAFSRYDARVLWAQGERRASR